MSNFFFSFCCFIITTGSYTLEEADGTHRIVEYSDDGKSGLHATVKRVGHGHHPEKYGHDEHSYGGGSSGGSGGYSGHGASSYANQNQYGHSGHY